MKKKILKRKTILGHKCILNHFNEILSTNYKGRWFLTLKGLDPSKMVFVTYHFS
jgi:hypothetical protein